MLAVLREVQIPLLAVLLIAGCAAKARREAGSRSATPGTGPALMFPPWLRSPATIGVCAAELILGAGLLITAGPAGSGSPALGIRISTALLFCMAAAVLHELRARRPDTGCGCFGELSGTPVSWRTIARALLLCCAALGTIGVPPLRMPGSPARAALMLAVAAAELAALAALSPEVGAIMARLGYAEPCELRRVPVARTMATLRASDPWRHYQPCLISPEPADVWREGCWRFLVFPGVLASRRVEVVFGVYLMGRRAPVRAGLVDADAAPVWLFPPRKPLQISKHV